MKAVVFSILILCMPFALVAETLDDPQVVAENPVETALHNQVETCENQSVDDAMQNPAPAAFTPGACSASAVCWNGSTIGCSSLSAFGGCSSGNHDCSVPRDGWVRCGAIFKSCAGCPGGTGECTQGASCISGIDCGTDGQCAGGTCHCD